MRLSPNTFNIETIISRINNNRLSLQPDFQRGEVWGMQKKKKLIDTIIRNWHIPPIHAVIDPTTRLFEVLDGQQRLVAIRDFVRNKFPIDGKLDPKSDYLNQLHGFYYKDLPQDIQDKFDDFRLTLVEIEEFQPEEAHELFYRLNQPTTLTAAEQRNAFMGKPRLQVKRLVSEMEELNLSKEFLGFSNSRLNYDDVLAKAAHALDNGTLRKKITGKTIADRYRKDIEFSEESIANLRSALEALSYGRERFSCRVKFNKASLFSSLIMLVTALKGVGIENVANQEFLLESIFFLQDAQTWDDIYLGPDERFNAINLMIPKTVYKDRSSSRVADVSSVVARDFIHWLTYYSLALSSSSVDIPHPAPGAEDSILMARKKLTHIESSREFIRFIEAQNWGEWI